MEKRKVYTPALVLMIIGVIFSLFSPLVAYILCTISIVQCVKNKLEYRTVPVIVFDVIGLLAALANHIYSALFYMGKI